MTMTRYSRRTRNDAGQRTKGAVVEWVEHEKSKRRAPIRLDKMGMMFWARAGAEPDSPYFESKDGGEVRAWLRKELAKNTEADRLEWMPVLKVEVEEEDRWGRGRSHEEERKVDFGFTIDRFYIALTRDKREWRKLEWHQCHADSATAVPENDRYEQSVRFDRGPNHEDFKPGAYNYHKAKPFVLPHREGNDATVAYTDELWEGLVATIEQIEESRKRLVKLVGTAGGLKEVARVGAERLPLKLTAKAEVS